VLVARGTPATPDIKLVLLLQEAFRRCQLVGAWGGGVVVLCACGIDPIGPGVVTGDTMARAFSDSVVRGVGLHRAWDRAVDVMSSAVPPSS
jgi:catalase